MSRARKGLKAPAKKSKKRRVNPRTRIQGSPRREFAIHAEELTREDIKAIERVFGPIHGDIIDVYGNI